MGSALNPGKLIRSESDPHVRLWVLRTSRPRRVIRRFVCAAHGRYVRALEGGEPTADKDLRD